MIAIDSSALIAIAKNEPEEEAFSQTIGATQAVIGAPTLFETRLVLQSLLTGGADRFVADIMANPAVTVVAFTAEHDVRAADTFEKCGRERGHPAKLNFGDCMAYAIAKELDAPLLYNGGDFVQTDIRPAYLP